MHDGDDSPAAAVVASHDAGHVTLRFRDKRLQRSDASAYHQTEATGFVRLNALR
jgi:hypothetical protein